MPDPTEDKPDGFEAFPDEEDTDDKDGEQTRGGRDPRRLDPSDPRYR